MKNSQGISSEQRVIWLTSGSHFMTHGFMTLFAAVMVVIAGENSMSFMALGIIANIGYFLYGLGGFPAGYLADRYGSKRVLTIGVFGMSISSILVGLSFDVYTFAIAYALLGLFSSIHHPAGLSFIARRVQERRGKAMGIHGVWGNLGLFFSPMVGAGCIWLFHSWRSAYLLSGGIGIIFSLILNRTKIPGELDFHFTELIQGLRSRSKREIAPVGTTDAIAWQTKSDAAHVIPIALLVLFVGSTLSGFIFRGSLTFFPALLRQEVLFIANHDQPVVMAGYWTTFVLSFGLIGAWFGGYINDKIKWPEFFTAFVFATVTPIFYLISRYSDNKLLVVSCLFSLVYYAWQPCQNYLIAKYTKKASHGMGFGVNFFLLFGIGSIATSIGGYVTDEYGVDRFYWLMSLISATAMLVSLSVFFIRKYRLRFFWMMEKE
ncbi:MAG: MFS transporter [Desulfobulbaceae bacterium]|nr:MFS transporter [Desulfobulbaceae bacterium]